VSLSSLPSQPTIISPAAQPIFEFTEAASAVIQQEHLRAEHVTDYNPKSPRSRELWARLRSEHEAQLDQLRALCPKAIRAGRLAGEAVATGQLAHEIVDKIRTMHGWVSAWLERHGDEWRKCLDKARRAAATDDAIPLIRPTAEAIGACTNRLHDIAIAIPIAEPTDADPCATTQPQRTPPAFVPIPADIAILTVLAYSQAALTIMQIVQKAHRLCCEAARQPNQPQIQPPGETSVKGRIPVLEANGFVVRPTHSDGSPTKRKGVAITAAGRCLVGAKPAERSTI
jgi:hypothetical protein